MRSAILVSSVFVANFAHLVCLLMADEDDSCYRHRILIGTVSGITTFVLFTILFR